MEKKLFIKVKCSICRGRKPLSCVYCDTLGETYVQASAKTIARIVNDDPYKKDIVEMIRLENKEHEED